MRIFLLCTIVLLTHCTATQTTIPPWKIQYIDTNSIGADGISIAQTKNMLIAATSIEFPGAVRFYRKKNTTKHWKATIVCNTCKDTEDARLIDIDTNGTFEIISAHEGKTKLLFLHRANSTYTKWKTLPIPASNAIKTSWMVVANRVVKFRNESIAIIAGSKEKNAGIYLFELPNNPFETEKWKSFQIAPANWIMGLMTHDVNQDGLEDVIASDKYGEIAWFENPGVFGLHWNKHSIGRVNTALWFFVHRDPLTNLLSILLADGSKEYTAVLFIQQTNSNNIQWDRKEISTNDSVQFPNEAKSVAMGDINCDGELDIIIASASIHHKIFWLSGSMNQTHNVLKGHLIFNNKPSKFDNIVLLHNNRTCAPDILISNEHNHGLILIQNPYNLKPSQ
jgi:hypothetical protein